MQNLSYYNYNIRQKQIGMYGHKKRALPSSDENARIYVVASDYSARNVKRLNAVTVHSLSACCKN